MDTYIFGAKATAVGLYRALTKLDENINVKAFLVSSLAGNVNRIDDVSVRDLSAVSSELNEEDKANSIIYVAVPELIHREISTLLADNGFENCIMLDSRMEAELMERYFEAEGTFPSIHSLPISNATTLPKLTIYAASFYKDKPLSNPPRKVDYYKKIYVGCDGALKNGVDIAGQAEFYDNTGDNISHKNPNRCEMTAHYWVWRNRLDIDDEYVGICHYRRMLDLSDDDLIRIKEHDVDVVLPYPMIHYPSADVHHTWYLADADWQVLREVLEELAPEYAEHFDEVLSEPYLYNYNMLLAKKQVFNDYMTWVNPILDRVEELTTPKATDRADRYIGYMGENLETLYFMTNLQHYKIYHTGRLLYT